MLPTRTPEVQQAAEVQLVAEALRLHTPPPPRTRGEQHHKQVLTNMALVLALPWVRVFATQQQRPNLPGVENTSLDRPRTRPALIVPISSINSIPAWTAT